jgi:hypothetical protein
VDLREDLEENGDSEERRTGYYPSSSTYAFKRAKTRNFLDNFPVFSQSALSKFAKMVIGRLSEVI